MIIKKMPNEEKRELYRRVKRACEKISVPQMIFIATLLTNMRYQDLSISEVSQFLQDHYSLRIV